jgi:IS30 family transposase
MEHPKRYVRLSASDREEVSRLRIAGLRPAVIARHLGRHRSTISRELGRNTTEGSPYRACTAQEHADALAHTVRKHHRVDRNDALRQYILSHLRLRWSPQQIARRLAVEYAGGGTMRISHEAIYQWIAVQPRGTLKRELARSLRQGRAVRKHRSRTPERRGKIIGMVPIEERPPEVTGRAVPGHWEGDLLVGKRNQSAIGTIVERTTRFTLLAPLHSKEASEVRRSFTRTVRKLPRGLTRSLTYDQGKEMAEHERFTVATGVQVYFAHPHSPWERGTNENTNGLLRQFFPKGTDLSAVSRREIRKVQDLLNGRPRKVLNWRTPAEVFEALVKQHQQEIVALGS